MKNLLYLLFVLPLLFSCGGASSDASNDAKNTKQTNLDKSLCEFIEIEKSLFKDILAGLSQKEVDVKYNSARQEFNELAKTINETKNKNEIEAIEKELNDCKWNDEEYMKLQTLLSEYAFQNQIQVIEGIQGNISMY